MYTHLVSTQDRLIEVTRELLWERGYVGTSPKAIQRRSGIGQGSMYHHFDGKPGLALAAINRTADEMRAGIAEQFSAPGTALERLTAYLRRERDVLRGCPIGRLTQDPDVLADGTLRAPVAETFAWLRERIAELLTEARDTGEIRESIDPATTSATVIATLQGGYVLARAGGSPAVFSDAIDGILHLLSR
jgi:AcrR family transcriptional regulator